MEPLNNIVNPVPGSTAIPGTPGAVVLPVAGVPGAPPVTPLATIPPPVAVVPAAALPVAALPVAPVAGAVPPVAVAPIGYVAPVVPVVPPAIPGAPVGGSRLSSVRNSVQTASTSFRNDLPLGTGIYLLKSCKYSITQGGKHKWSTFSVMCLAGVKDAQDIAYGTHGYCGPKPGDTYELGTYQDMSPQAEQRTIKNNLIALRMCLGWTEERLKQ